MLGHRVVRALEGHDVIAPKRADYQAPGSLDQFNLTRDDYVINCIGAIPQKGYRPNEMVKLNSHFPHLIAQEGRRVIQIATDCTFSGTRGSYTEADTKDATDDYGLSKSNGEPESFMNIRTSIVGPELTSKKSLFEFVRNQPTSETIKGFCTHYWNGVTTDAFAQVVRGVIDQGLFMTGTQHLVPADIVSKYQLLKMFAEKLGRTDLDIIPTITARVDRTLATIRPQLNTTLWNIAGYQKPPTIQELIEGMRVD
jgi:dTDP-4-dehydrorhamnose reductase